MRNLTAWAEACDAAGHLAGSLTCGLAICLRCAHVYGDEREAAVREAADTFHESCITFDSQKEKDLHRRKFEVLRAENERLLSEADQVKKSNVEMLAEIDRLEADRDALLAVARCVPDLVELAETAMHQANNDGAEWNVQEELADIRRALAAAIRAR